MARPRKAGSTPKNAQTYRHPESDLPARPEIGAQAHFKKAKPPTTYRFDSSLAPSLEWDGQNSARETAEHLIKEIAGSGLRIADLAKQPASKERDREIAALQSSILHHQSSLRRISGPFLNWSGKAERLSFDVPTLPLFVHERLSTSAILDTLKGHQRDKQDDFLGSLFGSPERSLSDQVLRAYEYRDNWVNRLILGDSLVVMNSLLRYESLGGQVQMIYVDPPYGVKFGSNFQPFVRKRDVAHNDDADMTREPEMVQAYRDTWELGLHSYLTYLRDRLLLARELLAPSGSIFVQISDENLHHVREVMDEVFGAENFCAAIVMQKTSGLSSPTAKVNVLSTIGDFILWYAKDATRVKYNQLYTPKRITAEDTGLLWLEDSDKNRRRLTSEERENPALIPVGSKLFRLDPIISQGFSETLSQPFTWQGKTYKISGTHHWKTTPKGMTKLGEVGRLQDSAGTIRYVRYVDDFPVSPLQNIWDDTGTGQFTEERLYVVQTSTKAVARCMLMTTEPGDLVLDPTCGSGTTAFVAEQWGRRWITCDTSRVPLALARQRLLTATFDYYKLKDESRGPAGGFVYERKQNQKGEEVGGIVPHITLKSIANNEPPAEEVLVDRPEVLRSVVRVTGPFSFEATIPTAEGLDTEVGRVTPCAPSGKGEERRARSDAPYLGEPHENYVQRMLEVLRRAPVLRLPGNQTVTLKNIRPPAKTLTLSAEAMVDSGRTPALTPALSPAEREKLSPSSEKSKRSDSTQQRGAIPPLPAGEGRGEGEGNGRSAGPGSSSQPVAILFGPENGPLSERLVREAWDEAGLKHYSRLYVIGFAIDPKARQFIDSAGRIGIPCTYLQATMDLQMGDLLKNMRSSQIFSVCGLPDVKVSKVEGRESKAKRSQLSTLDARLSTQFQIELLGLDTFDPVTMEADHLKATDVPAWFLDTDYNGMVFRVRQAFFPRTGAWENLKKSLRVEFEDTVWDHLAGTTSAPFPAGEHNQIAVKVIDPRGNELLVVKKLEGGQ